MTQAKECHQCNDTHEWVAVLADGTEMRECPDRNGSHNARRHLEAQPQRVVELRWEPRADPNGQRLQLMAGAGPDEHLIFFRRRLLELSPEGAEMGRVTIHALGVERANGDNHYWFLMPTGVVLDSSDQNAV